MASRQYSRPTGGRVLAQFEDCALSFVLPLEATLEDLAERLTTFGATRDRVPLSIVVRLDA